VGGAPSFAMDVHYRQLYLPVEPMDVYYPRDALSALFVRLSQFSPLHAEVDASLEHTELRVWF